MGVNKKKEKGEKRKHVTNLGSYSHLRKPGASPTRLTLRTRCQEEHEQDVNRKARGSWSQRAGTGDGDSVRTSPAKWGQRSPLSPLPPGKASSLACTPPARPEVPPSPSHASKPGSVPRGAAGRHSSAQTPAAPLA